MKLNDRLVGVLAVVAGIAIISGTFGFRDIPGQPLGSAFFPRIIGAVLIATGFCQMLVARPGPNFLWPGWLKGFALVRVVSVIALSLVWLFSVSSLGFLLATGLLIIVLSIIAGGRPLVAFGVGVVSTGVLYTVFAVLLRVPLPHGVLEAWI